MTGQPGRYIRSEKTSKFDFPDAMDPADGKGTKYTSRKAKQNDVNESPGHTIRRNRHDPPQGRTQPRASPFFVYPPGLFAVGKNSCSGEVSADIFCCLWPSLEGKVP